MGFRLLKVEEAKVASRYRKHAAEMTTEWRQLQEAIAKGFKRGEMAEVTFDEQRRHELGGAKTVRRVFRDVVAEYLKEQGLNKQYSMQTFTRDKVDYIQVFYDEPVVAARRRDKSA